MTDPSATLDLSYHGDAATLGEARRDVLARLSSWGADESAKSGAALIVSELATNALQASPGSTYTIQVKRIDGNHAVISVRNQNAVTVPPQPDQWKPVDRSSLRGRGLAIVNSLSEQVIVEHRDGDVIVTAHIRLR